MKHIQRQKIESKCWKKQIMNLLIIGLILGGFSIIIALVSMFYSTGDYGIEMFKSYILNGIYSVNAK